jgi:hypothetical protein
VHFTAQLHQCMLMGLDAMGDKAFAHRVRLRLVQAVEGGGDFSATVCAHEHFKTKHPMHHPVGFASGWGAFLFVVRKAGSSTPDADNHLLWALAPIGAGLGQGPALQRFFEPHAVEHAFQKGQTAPGGDFAGGELQIERCCRWHGGSKLH